MTHSLTPKDYILISGYIDDVLSDTQKESVGKRILIDPAFKQAVDELVYTKRMLQSLPKIRAPHNFTLSPEKVKKTLRRQWFQPAWGMASAVSAVLTVIIFASTYLLPGLSASRAAAPMEAPAADKSLLGAESSNAVSTTPMIIFWNPQRAYGMGGGGGGDGSVGALNSAGTAPIQGVPTISPEIPPYATQTSPGVTLLNPGTPTSGPASAISGGAANSDLSTLILGIPDTKSQGTISTGAPQTSSNFLAQIQPKTWWMAGFAFIALVSACLAFFTRRR